MSSSARTLVAAERLAPHARLYLGALRVRHVSPGLLDRSARVLSMLGAFLERRGRLDVRQVRESDVVAFAAQLGRVDSHAGRPYSLQTRALYLTVVRRFFAHLAKRRVVLLDPARQLTLPRVDRLPRLVLNHDQAARLVTTPAGLKRRIWSSDAVEDRNRALVELLYGTALRISECLRLDLADVDLAGRSVLVRDGKGHRDRFVPLPGRAAAALELYLRGPRAELLRGRASLAVFVAVGGARLARVTVGVLLRQRSAAAKLPPGVSPHVLRHTCATHLLQGGADVRHVQELLGHREINTTARYTRVAITDLRRVIDRAHPRRLWPASLR